MVTTQDASIGIGLETTYRTGVTPTRWFEFVDESFTWNKNVVQGQGLRVGGRVARSGRRVVPTADGSGDMTIEALSKGMGLLWQACLGSSTSTTVGGTTYQQVHTLGDTPPSLTVQKGLPQAGTSNVDAYTYLGCMVDSWELDFPNANLVTLKPTFDCGDLTVATSYAAPSYATGGALFHFANGTISTGTLTSPTATALASATSSIADVRGGSLTVNNNLTKDRQNLGGSGRKSKPTVGLREINVTLTVEYDASTYRDLLLNETPICIVLTFTGAALSMGVETLQVVLPEMKLDSPLAQVNGTDLITTDLSFTVLDNLTAAQPIWIVTRTADAAL